jgi:hypothetical protein
MARVESIVPDQLDAIAFNALHDADMLVVGIDDFHVLANIHQLFSRTRCAMLTTDHGPGSLRKSEKGDWMEVASPANPETDGRDDRGSLGEVFQAFLKLGVTSFGGPIAHLGYFRHEFVERRKWIDEAVYADLIALCQFLPGPASSQVGFSQGNPARSRTSWWAGGVVRIHDAIGLARGRRAPSIQFYPSRHRPLFAQAG